VKSQSHSLSDDAVINNHHDVTQTTCRDSDNDYGAVVDALRAL